MESIDGANSLRSYRQKCVVLLVAVWIIGIDLACEVWKYHITKLTAAMQSSRRCYRRQGKLRQLLELFNSSEATRILRSNNTGQIFGFGDLKKVPCIAGVLRNVNVETLSAEKLLEIDGNLPSWIEDHTSKVTATCVAAILKGREASGLVDIDLPVDNVIGELVNEAPTTDSILQRASAVFIDPHYEGEPRCISFGDLVKSHCPNSYTREDDDPWVPPGVSTDALLAAEALLNYFNVPHNTTIAHMDSVVKRYVCEHCWDRSSRWVSYCNSWADTVRETNFPQRALLTLVDLRRSLIIFTNISDPEKPQSYIFEQADHYLSPFPALRNSKSLESLGYMYIVSAPFLP